MVKRKGKKAAAKKATKNMAKKHKKAEERTVDGPKPNLLDDTIYAWYLEYACYDQRQEWLQHFSSRISQIGASSLLPWRIKWRFSMLAIQFQANEENLAHTEHVKAMIKFILQFAKDMELDGEPFSRCKQLLFELGRYSVLLQIKDTQILKENPEHIKGYAKEVYEMLPRLSDSSSEEQPASLPTQTTDSRVEKKSASSEIAKKHGEEPSDNPLIRMIDALLANPEHKMERAVKSLQKKHNFRAVSQQINNWLENIKRAQYSKEHPQAPASQKNNPPWWWGPVPTLISLAAHELEQEVPGDQESQKQLVLGDQKREEEQVPADEKCEEQIVPGDEKSEDIASSSSIALAQVTPPPTGATSTTVSSSATSIVTSEERDLGPITMVSQSQLQDILPYLGLDTQVFKRSVDAEVKKFYKKYGKEQI